MKGRSKTSAITKILNHMRKGAVLIKQGEQHFLIPGGVVHPVTAAKLKEHPQVRGGRDGMWPGHEQTWRIWPAEVA